MDNLINNVLQGKFTLAKAIYEDEEITRDAGFLNTQISLDVECSKESESALSNRFIAKFDASIPPDITYGDYFYLDGTEFGGVFGELETLTESNSLTWKGDTFRGFLKKSILEPNAGDGYLTVSGDANTIIGTLLARQQLDLIYKVKEVASINIPSFTFRYENFIDGINRMLATVNYKLRICAERHDYLGLIIRLEAVPIVDYSSRFEASTDNRIQLRITDKQDGIGALICLGGGELTARMVRYLRMVNGVISVVPSASGGVTRRVAVFDYPNAESEEDLIQRGTERFLELISSKSLEVTDFETTLNIDIGDIIGARNWNDGTYFSRPIVSKNIVVSGVDASINYKIEGE